MLIVFGGLPGTGKTTLSRHVARALGAVHLRIDVIEQAIRNAGVLATDVGPAGYAVAHALAETNLAGGLTVIADCVNPVRESRAAWRDVAARTSVPLVEIEVVCSDIAEHRRRVEQRGSDIPGLVPPTWHSVSRHRFEPWTERHLEIDTGRLGAEAAAEIVQLHVATLRGGEPTSTASSSGAGPQISKDRSSPT